MRFWSPYCNAMVEHTAHARVTLFHKVLRRDGVIYLKDKVRKGTTTQVLMVGCLIHLVSYVVNHENVQMAMVEKLKIVGRKDPKLSLLRAQPEPNTAWGEYELIPVASIQLIVHLVPMLPTCPGQFGFFINHYADPKHGYQWLQDTNVLKHLK